MKTRALLMVVCATILAESTSPAQTAKDQPYVIDLATALRLAGAQNLDVQIAQERLRQAQADRAVADEQFLPWLSPGVGYHRRDGVAQSVPSGVISDAHFDSYSPGATLAANITLGDAIYNGLSARQLVKASGHALEAQRADSILAAAQAYFDLVKTRALVDVATQAIDLSSNYQGQLHEAVAAGVAFKGDELRVQTLTGRYAIDRQRALEQQYNASANLAQVLHLDPKIELVPSAGELVPMALIATNATLNSLVAQAIAVRPELKQNAALLAAARAGRNGAVYGPLVPSVGAQVFAGGLGGGPDGGPDHFGAEGDYTVGLNWRIGPGGLLDSGRINASKSKVELARLADLKLQDAIAAEVVSGLARVQSIGAQIELSRTNLAAATETLRLTRERKQFGVGIVLEDIDAQQSLNQARSDYVTAVAEYNKAQFGLNRALGNTWSKPAEK